MGAHDNSRSRALVRHLGSALGLCGLGLLLYHLGAHAGQLATLAFTPELAVRAGLSIGLLSACMWGYGLVWWLAAGGSALGDPVTAQRVYARANVAKYVPGNVFQYVGRYQLAVRCGFAGERVTASILVEAAVMVGTAAFVGLVGQWASPAPVAFLPYALRGAGSMAAAGVVVVAIALWQRARAVRFAKTLRDTVSPPTLTAAVALDAALLGVIGAAVWVLAGGLVPHAPIGWFDWTWGFAIAWVLGFVVPGAPGGLGVREAVLFGLFAPRIGPGPAALLFLAFRVATTVADLVVYAASFAGGPLGAERRVEPGLE